MTIDYAIMDYSEYTDLDFNIVSKGEIRPQNESAIPFVGDRRVPQNILLTGEEIQVFISDYFVHSLLYSVYKTGLLTFRISENPLSPGNPLKVGNISILLPSLSKMYPKSTPIFLDFQSTRGFSPMFNISKGETYMTLQFDMGLGVLPSGGKEEIMFALLTQMDMTLDFGITKDMTIKTQMSSFTFKLKGVKKDVIGLDHEDLNSMFGIVTGIVRNFVNWAINDMQIPIPEIPYFTLNLNSTYIKEMDRYLLFETSPKVILKNELIFNDEIKTQENILNPDSNTIKNIINRIDTFLDEAVQNIVEIIIGNISWENISSIFACQLTSGVSE